MIHHTPRGQGVVGLDPTVCWAFFSFPVLALIHPCSKSPLRRYNISSFLGKNVMLTVMGSYGCSKDRMDFFKPGEIKRVGQSEFPQLTDALSHSAVTLK